MNDLPFLILMFVVGALLAALYLVGLWFTVRRIHGERLPVVYFTTSFILRTGLVVVAFYFILRSGNWQHLGAALAGFVALRALTIHRLRRRLTISRTGKETPT